MTVRAPVRLFALVSCLAAGSAAGAPLKVPGQFPTIQAAVDAAGPGDVIKIKAGTYNESVVINNHDDLTLVGQGKVTIDGGITDVLQVTGCDDVTLKGLRLINGIAGIAVLSSTDVVVENCIVRNSVTYGIGLGTSTGCRVVDSNVKHTGGYGVVLVDATSCTVEGTKIASTEGAGIAVHGHLNAVVDVEVSESGEEAILLGYGGSAATNCLVQGNTLVDAGHDGIRVTDQSSNCSILDNVIDAPGDRGIMSSLNTSFLVIDGNKIRSSASDGFVLFCEDSTISRNKVKKAKGSGMFVGSWTTDTLFRSNSVKKSALDGLRVDGTDNHFVQNVAKKSGDHDLADLTPPGANVYSGNSFGTVN